MDLISRFRTTRGFGVHSPFAYRFITGVLTERDALYYAYDCIDPVASGRRDLLSARLIYRVGIFFSGRPVAVAGDTTPAGSLALDMAGNSRVGLDGHPAAIIVTDMERWDGLTAGMVAGMSFKGSRMGVIVTDPALPLQHFKLYF